jgi:hypothetical protein
MMSLVVNKKKQKLFTLWKTGFLVHNLTMLEINGSSQQVFFTTTPSSQTTIPKSFFVGKWYDD